MSLSIPVIVLILILIVLVTSVRVLQEYERGVMFTLGRFTGVKGPGIRLVLPFAQQMRKLELRTMVLNVPKQDVISRDNVSVKVSAVVYFRIVDPEKAILQVINIPLKPPVSSRRRRSVRSSVSMRWMRCSRSETS